MPRRGYPASGYRAMWLLAMFDLPVDDLELRRAYTRFRAALLRLGFSMLQYSVYAHYANSPEAEQALRRAVQRALPPRGQVRLLSVTDRQFGRMQTFVGKAPRKAEKPPPQVIFL